MNLKNLIHKTARAVAVGSSAVLGIAYLHANRSALRCKDKALRVKSKWSSYLKHNLSPDDTTSHKYVQMVVRLTFGTLDASGYLAENKWTVLLEQKLNNLPLLPKRLICWLLWWVGISRTTRIIFCDHIRKFVMDFFKLLAAMPNDPKLSHGEWQQPPAAQGGAN